MPTIREQLAPLIRAAGIAAVARSAGIHRPDLSAWLADPPRRGMRDDKIERLCEVLGVGLVAVEINRTTPSATPALGRCATNPRP